MVNQKINQNKIEEVKCQIETLHLTEKLDELEDSDELQALDEGNFQWVEAWKTVAKEIVFSEFLKTKFTLC